MLSSLSTLRYELSYISQALTAHGVELPTNYWRFKLACFFLRVEENEKLPAALRRNFCPLFWFTNLLVLLSPIWGAAFLLVYVMDFFMSPVAKVVGAYTEKQVKRRRKEAMSEKIADITKELHNYNQGVFSSKYYAVFRKAEASFYNNSHLVSYNEETGSYNWDDDSHLTSDLPLETVFYILAKRILGDKYTDVYYDVARYVADCTKKKEEKKAARYKIPQRISMSFNEFLSITKTLCKVIVFPVSLIGLIYLTPLLFSGFRFICLQLYNFILFTFVTHFNTTLIVAFTLCCIAGLIYTLAVYVGSSRLSSFFAIIWRAFCVVFGYVITPFVFLVGVMIKLIKAVYLFTKMFFSNNCPAITIKD